MKTTLDVVRTTFNLPQQTSVLFVEFQENQVGRCVLSPTNTPSLTRMKSLSIPQQKKIFITCQSNISIKYFRLLGNDLSSIVKKGKSSFFAIGESMQEPQSSIPILNSWYCPIR